MVLDNLEVKKRYPNIKFILKIHFKDSCYENALPNIYSEIDRDLKIILGKISKGIFNTKICIINLFYLLTIEPFHKNEPVMPYIIGANGRPIKLHDEWDIGFALKLAKLKEGLASPERYSDLMEVDKDSLAKILIKFPKIEDKKQIERLVKKIYGEFSQLKLSTNIGKVLIIETDYWYFMNLIKIKSVINNLFKSLSQLTTIILTRDIPFNYPERKYNWLFFENKNNNFKLPQKFYNLLSSR